MNTDEMRSRTEAATPGPWYVNDDNEGMPPEYSPFWVISGDSPETFDGEWYMELHCGHLADAEFIAHAREDIPALLDALDAKERETAELREQLEAMTKDMKYVIRVTAPLGYAPCGICARINSGCSAKCTHDDYVDFEWRGAGKEKNDG